LRRLVETRSFTVLRVSFQELFVFEWVNPDTSRRRSCSFDVVEVTGVLKMSNERRRVEVEEECRRVSRNCVSMIVSFASERIRVDWFVNSMLQYFG
jgi:hypothetical protein